MKFLTPRNISPIRLFIILGSQHTNPTEAYWANVQSNQAAIQALYSSQQQQTQQTQQTVIPSVINGSTTTPSYMSSYQPVSVAGYQTNAAYAQSGAIIGNRHHQPNMWYNSDPNSSFSGQYGSKAPLSNISRQHSYSPNLSNHS